MNKNVDNYKKAVDQIHADENVKEKVLQNAKQNKNKGKIYIFRYVTAIAAVALIAFAGVNFMNKPKEDVLSNNKEVTKEKMDLAEFDIERFESVEEIKKVLKKNENSRYYATKSLGVMEDAVAESTNSADISSSSSSREAAEDYSKTNNQVENVDEADIVKTDGKYIYYARNGRVYIVDKDLNLEATIYEKNFTPNQIFVNGDKLVIFGNLYNRNNIVYEDEVIPDRDLEDDEEETVKVERVSTRSRNKTEARVYNIKKRQNPKLVRKVSLDGYYKDARMIENNIYFISTYSVWYRKNMEDFEFLPTYSDSYIEEDEDVVIDATDIAYFKNTNSYAYSIIAGFSLDSKEAVNVETFFGAGSELYVSENNMYIVTPKYSSYWYAENSNIYKFKLENSKITAVAEGFVKGYVNNQFSIDEYKGNLRIATTCYNSRRSYMDGDEKYTTRLTILDKNLDKIGEIEDLVKDEKIYSVRFIGKVGYIVTFEQIDPLWVLDLSNPRNPVVKGSLEIPGYSSYLHPYDETYIIGIGYNVKDNGYGGVTNDTMKMSMFDVSDLENPKEIFNVSIGDNYVSSNITHDHKALFFNKEENLIGFPISSYSYKKYSSTSYQRGLALFRINLEDNEFEEIPDLVFKNNSYPERAIYIGDSIYVIFTNEIIKYDMENFEELDSVKLK